MIRAFKLPLLKERQRDQQCQPERGLDTTMGALMLDMCLYTFVCANVAAF